MPRVFEPGRGSAQAVTTPLGLTTTRQQQSQGSRWVEVRPQRAGATAKDQRSGPQGQWVGDGPRLLSLGGHHRYLALSCVNRVTIPFQHGRKLVKSEVAHTLNATDNVENEMQQLFVALGG